MKSRFLKFLIVLFFFVLVACTETALESDAVTLVRCIDGDTAVFLVEGVETTVRFLAIDTPETVDPNEEVEAYGEEASTYTCNLLTNANEITLEYEENKVDVYDRTLAWVFVDDALIQELLVLEGLAEVAYIYDDYQYTEILYETQEMAKENKVGLWTE